MKIGESETPWTRSSCLWAANTNGAPMHPAPIGMADRTQKNSAKHNLNIISAPSLVSIAYWRRGTLVRQYICTPMPTAPLLLAHRSTLRNNISAPKKKHPAGTLSKYSARLPVIRIGTPNPLTRRWVCLPFGTRGDTLACSRRGGVWGPNTRGQTLLYSTVFIM